MTCNGVRSQKPQHIGTHVSAVTCGCIAPCASVGWVGVWCHEELMSSMVQKLADAMLQSGNVFVTLWPRSPDLSQDNLYLWPDHRIIRGDQMKIFMSRLTWNFVTKIQQTYTRTRREEV